MRSWLTAVSMALLAVTLAKSSCEAGPTVTVGSSVAAARRVSVERIDHSAWDALLQKHVDARGFVDYSAWKSSASDQQALDGYLRHLSSASLSGQSSREARLAFWINAYNASTMKGILREYPTSSIRNHTAKVFGYNIWKDLVLPVDGKNYSLEQIEHEVLRKMGEPRIHFAIVCASIGCPRLLNRAYTASELDQQLSANANAFFADRAKFAYDANRRTMQLSQVLKWFAEDFGANQAEQLRAISPYLPDAASQQLARSGSASISYLDYDWELNDRAKLRSAARK